MELHPQDPIPIIEKMKNGAVHRWDRAIKKFTGKSLFEITIDEWVQFRKVNWHKCGGLGYKSLQQFDEAIKCTP